MLKQKIRMGAKRYALGASGLRVSRLGVGGGSLTMGGDEQAAMTTLQACWDAGLRHYDTAPLYNDSEARLGRFFAGRDCRDVVVSTKIGRYPAPAGERRFDFSGPAIEQSIEVSVKRLGLHQLDMVSVHDLTTAMVGEGFPEARRALLEGGLERLRALKRSGVVRAIGLALYDAAGAIELLQAASFDYVLIVGGYSLIRHDALDALLPICLARGVGVMMASPFHTGLLVSGAMFDFRPADADMLERVKRIEQVCAWHGVSLPAAALQFPLLHPAIANVVVGHRSPEEVATNLSWLEAPIPTVFWSDLVDQGLLPTAARSPL
jgi:D-threo-aldose 1-dehydrogenase